MPDYRFFKKGKHIVVLETADTDGVLELLEHNYEKQFEEVSATDKERALNRYDDIRREKRIDQHNFLAGAGVMPLIGILTAVVFFTEKVARKKSFYPGSAFTD